MPPDTFGDYTPSELVSLSELLRKQADEIRAIAESMNTHEIEGMRMRNRRSIMESIDKAQTFVANGWKSFVEAREGNNDFGKAVDHPAKTTPRKKTAKKKKKS